MNSRHRDEPLYVLLNSGHIQCYALEHTFSWNTRNSSKLTDWLPSVSSNASSARASAAPRPCNVQVQDYNSSTHWRDLRKIKPCTMPLQCRSHPAAIPVCGVQLIPQSYSV